MWLDSFLIAAAAVCVAVPLGAALGLCAVHLRSPGLRVAALLAGAFPLAVPMYLHGMAAWQVAVALGLYAERPTQGPWTDPLIVGLVQGLRLSAVVHLLTAAGWQMTHARWLEAGLLVAPRAWVTRHILWPALSPFIALGALLVAVISVTDVSVPLLFQVRSSLALRLWDAHYRALDPAAAWQAMAAPSVLLLFAAALVLPPLWRRAAPLLTARRDPAEIPRGRLPRWITFASLAVLLALANASLLHLLRQIPSIAALIEAFRANTALVAASVSTALGATVVALAAGLLLAPQISRGRRLATSTLTLAVLIFAVPGFLWAAAAIYWWNQPGWRGALLDLGAVRWLVLGGRLAVLPALLVGLALARISPAQREAASLARLGARRTRWSVLRPQIERPLWAAAAICALAVLGDLDAAILMDLPGRTTLVVGLCNRLHISPRSPEVALMAAVILTTALALLAVPLITAAAMRKIRGLL
jgi:ABC-type Fe3+ transport system permease subunit